MKCPYCGKAIQRFGRKSYPIPFVKVYKAFQFHLRGRLKGKVHFTNTAKKIKELYDIEVSPGFVQTRLQKEIKIHPEVARKLDRMKKVYQKSE